MLTVTTASGSLITLGAVRVGSASESLGDFFAIDTVRRVGSLLRLPFTVVDVPTGWEHVNVHPSRLPGPADVVLRPSAPASLPPYGDPLVCRLAWLVGTSVEEASVELAEWRSMVAGWAESPSKPMCAQVQEDLLAALCSDLDTRGAVDALRGSTALGLPDGCLFETWAWADRLLGLDLARDVGR